MTIFIVAAIFLCLMINACDAVGDNVPQLTIASVVAYDSVQNQISWHIRGLLVGTEELKMKFAGRLTIEHKIIWVTNMSQGPDIAANIVKLASDLYYREREKNHSVIFCHPGSFEDIYQLGSIAQEWNVLLLTTVGSSYVITPKSFPTVVSMTYRQQRSFAEFMMVVFDEFNWKTNLWLCDQETSTGVYAPSVCFNAGKILADHPKFVTNMIDFNSKKAWDPVQLLESAKKQSRSKIINNPTLF
ncbi:uncharacterized protein LOC129598248 [Paramacrobiotus metropolitanus]|uniref:uncharacterized protein LOC129598248 n=1 Tax=Paramacrobiotus metropolitanus TaxID=2943436 RepID=UPI0024460DE3|nr:uncharacterized protein LOC129598248 [Paramacrobiotus metropolitanus]